MTLRVLLQKLHSVAAQVGADSQVHIAGFKDTRFIEDVQVQKRPRSTKAVLKIGQNSLKRTKRTELGYQKNRELSNSRYSTLRELGLCYTCKGDLGASPTAQCPTCREKMNQRKRKS